VTLAKLATEKGVSAGDQWVTVPAAKIREAITAARAEGYDFYSFISCVDHLARDDGRAPFQGGRTRAGSAEHGREGGRPPSNSGAGAVEEARFEVVYQLRDLSRRRQLRIRAFLPAADPVIDSVHDLFGPANWDEREVWDLFGVRFTGHPELTRILMPDDWVGHPLRRDFPVGGDPVDFSQEHEEWQTAPRRG